ncbi:DUF5000 domain-containing lipoprotein [Chitinophaga sp. GCM10012297]|uniref:DUF5126 domain-containing protein n=1 Tax=Chitinophaga chungangae TaxID=2821488 RepID=A0ABS3YH01_9BACT|nr:DUF5000 domain-containing lipoprotein [Chitinophaga chungangae]MBO9153563.1 DUF5126 domain-containing protein [Chitinophaga chungangae]
MKKISAYLLLIAALAACKEEGASPLSKNGNAPQPISSPSFTPLPGAAKITYTLPDDQNLAYVRAEFEVNGEKRETKASFYKREVIVEGFGDVSERTVKLYSVSYAEQSSAPVEIKIKPLPPAIDTVFKSLAVRESFGGINTSYKNTFGGNIVIGVLVWNEHDNAWDHYDNYYTAADSGNFSVRGLPAVQAKFGLFVRDRWENHTDTMEVTLTPIYEEELDKKKITDGRKKNWAIPQLFPLPQSGKPIVEPGNLSSWPFGNMFDGNTTGNGFHTSENKDQPIWIPIDLGVTARLSRYKLWQRPGGYAFSHGNPHQWEIWGTNTPKDVNSWVLLDARTMVKPSGLPLGEVTNEDNLVVTNGQEYEFPVNTPAVRYIAWKHIDSWASVQGMLGFFHVVEMTFWGQVQ